MKENCVLLGGWSRTHRTYQKLVDTAPPEKHVYTIPHTSLIPDIKIPPIHKINETILQEIKTQNLTHTTLIGHSLGGAFAISFTANHPEYVKKLVLVDSEGIPDKRNFSVAILNWIKDSIFVHGAAKAKENINALIRIIQNFRYYFAAASFANSVDVRNDAQKIKTPTLILWGEKDEVIPLESAKDLNRLIKHSRLVVLDGADHDWLIHNPQEFWNNIEK